MSFAVVTKWSRGKHGCIDTEPHKYLSTKYLILDKLLHNDKKKFNELIKYNSYYKFHIICSTILPIKNSYLYLDRLFANINYSFLNFIKKLKNKYSKVVLIKKDPWSYKFREIRGRFPNYNEYLLNKFI